MRLVGEHLLAHLWDVMVAHDVVVLEVVDQLVMFVVVEQRQPPASALTWALTNPQNHMDKFDFPADPASHHVVVAGGIPTTADRNVGGGQGWGWLLDALRRFARRRRLTRPARERRTD